MGPLSALDRGYPKFMLQYKSQDFVHTLRGVSALDSSPHILVTNGLGQSRSRRSPKPLSSLHTGTPGSWSPSQRSDQWRQVLNHPFLAHQVLLKQNCPVLLWNAQFHSYWHSSHFFHAIVSRLPWSPAIRGRATVMNKTMECIIFSLRAKKHFPGPRGVCY